MQVDYIATAARICQCRLLTIAATVTQRAATSFQPEHYPQIVKKLNHAHYKSIFGCCISRFDVIHHVLCLPKPVQTSESNTIGSKTAMLKVLVWLKGSKNRALKAQFRCSHCCSSTIIHFTATISWVHSV
ncbi:uncharacterized protein MEPE_06822 [Melanopsichium pennsylvanicum]|uniref:Uncharacterized protein n=1 Tax=Melanopsichium pennsylvanicum TaxID=63383 RepID=A0AAJ5C8M0_9BASI|nr:uncharacterized protein MEPE_06822 [Melanopsichium pennsylvanicum]